VNLVPKVYVVNRGCHDYSGASKFGQLVYLSESSMDRFDLSKIWRKFKPVLDESSPEDFILLSGLTVMSIVATTIFSQLHGKLNILIFKGYKKSNKGEYIPETIHFGVEQHGKVAELGILPSALNRLRTGITSVVGRE
jgi:hypothetical protein